MIIPVPQLSSPGVWGRNRRTNWGQHFSPVCVSSPSIIEISLLIEITTLRCYGPKCDMWKYFHFIRKGLSNNTVNKWKSHFVRLILHCLLLSVLYFVLSSQGFILCDNKVSLIAPRHIVSKQLEGSLTIITNSMQLVKNRCLLGIFCLAYSLLPWDRVCASGKINYKMFIEVLSAERQVGIEKCET